MLILDSAKIESLLRKQFTCASYFYEIKRASLEASLAPVQAAEDKALTQSALLAEGGGAEEVDVDAEERTQS